LSGIAVECLFKQYEGAAAPAVNNVSFTVKDREFLVLLGPSGCGKSTVLRIIAGLEPPTAGRILIDGAVVNKVPAKARDIAMVFQSYALYPHMKVYDNMAFGLRRRGVERVEIDRRVRDAAWRLGLLELLDRKPYALSGGQRQRVALGRAIVRNPKVFLFDEPLSNLDAALRVSTRNDLMRQQREIGTTAIYVTHDQVEAMTMGNRICIMNKGEVVQIGEPLEIYRRPANTFVARFLGNPPMNLLRAHVGAGVDGPSLAIAGFAIELGSEWGARLASFVGKDVLVGIRPEDLYDVPPPDKAMPSLPTRVVAVEPLGAETILVLELEGSGEEIVARVGRSSATAAGARIDIRLDRAEIHVFDPTTSKAIA
jgi:multiple sugar transport system ATP-binding protein